MDNSNLSIEFAIKKYDCPSFRNCNAKHKNRFSRYAIYDGTNEVQLLDESYGVCDRANNCQYQKTHKGYTHQILDTYKRTGKVYPDYPTIEQYKASKKRGKSTYKRPYVTSSYQKRIEEINRAIDNQTEDKPVITSEVPDNRYYIPDKSYNRFELKAGSPIPYFFDGLPVNEDLIKSTCSKYRIGTIKDNYVSKSNLLLPYIDTNGDIHGVEIKEFDKDRNTLKRSDGTKVNKQYHYYKLTSDSIRAVVSDSDKFLMQYQEQKPQRLTCFGTHLISEDTSVVNVFESGKNCILFELLKSEEPVVNIATGGQSFLTSNRFKWLKEPKYQHIDIKIIPDIDSIDNWRTKVQKIREELKAINEFEVISPIKVMRPFFFDLIDSDGTLRHEPSFDSNFYLHRYSDISKIDIADLILDYWQYQSKGVKKHAPRIEPVKQVATIEPKLSNPTKVKAKPLKSIKSDLSKPVVKRNYKIEVNGKVSYIKGTTLLKNLPAKSVVTLREPKVWSRYNLFKLFNESTGIREVVKMPFYIPDEAVLKEMTGKGWIIETKVEVDTTIKPVVKKHAPRVQQVTDNKRLDLKSRNTTTIERKPLQSSKQGYNEFHLYNDLTGKHEVKIIPDYIPDTSVIEGMPGNGWRIKRMIEQ